MFTEQHQPGICEQALEHWSHDPITRYSHLTAITCAKQAPAACLGAVATACMQHHVCNHLLQASHPMVVACLLPDNVLLETAAKDQMHLKQHMQHQHSMVCVSAMSTCWQMVLAET